MNILLLSMPDSFEHMPAHGMRLPTASLTSLAGNIDAHHRVAVADLILVQRRVRASIERLVRQFEPDLVGLSVMTFQRRSALRIAELVRSLRPAARIVAGGYDPSLAPEAYAGAADFLVRGEGEITFRELVRALERGNGYGHIEGLWYRDGDRFSQNPDRPVSRLNGDEIRLPNRGARVLDGYTLMGRPVDVVETSRGCTFDCSFCSIVALRGRNFHTYRMDRVLEDIRDALDRGARTIFLVDDNITLDVARFEAFCRALIDARLNRAEYIVQAMTSALANHGATLAPLMRRAGFRYVFLGIENVLESDLSFLRARSKNEERAHGHVVRNAARRAIDHLHRNGLYVVGGLIVGNPDDTRASIEANLDFARRYVDWPYIQHPTPYPRTPMSNEFRARGLIVSDRWEEYDGTTAVVRSEHLAAEEIEFMRWRAERWMKLRHMPASFLHSPFFVARIGHRMLRHTFRGSTLRSMLGLEDARKAFERYRSRRRAERNYL
ncbi:MAG: B12-binding domain-containing radical SAM protein [Acidobacteriia bacterium]|nr:B12-binding domain-containing radical SAM protein [Terriglobia bacterium]